MKMSTQNTIVERASAELTKRINGLRKHSSNSTTSSVNNNNSNTIVGKTSVMERVTNVLCGGGSSSNNSNNVHNTNLNQNSATNMSISTPEKPYRYQSKHQHNSIFSHHNNKMIGGSAIPSSNSNQSTPQSMRKYQKQQGTNKRFTSVTTSPILTIEQLFLDEKFLQQFLFYFSSYERRDLAQVCTTWRDILYRNPAYFSGLVPVLQCREMRATGNQDKVKLYNSIIRRGFHSIALNGATDEDALDIVHTFPLASKHIHSLSLRGSSISDRGLEALLDFLQVSPFQGTTLITCDKIFSFLMPWKFILSNLDGKFLFHPLSLYFLCSAQQKNLIFVTKKGKFCVSLKELSKLYSC